MVSITCIGSPIIDVSLRVNQNFLQKHAITPNNRYSSNDLTSNLFQFTKSSVRTVGGSITNTARVLRWASQGSLNVVYVGAIGTDANGEFIVKLLEDEGVVCAFKRLQGATAKCAVFIGEEDDSRTLCTDLGVSKLFSVQDMEEGEIWKSNYIYFSALFLPISIECVNKIVDICKETNKKLFFNLGSKLTCSKYSKNILNILPCVDVLFGNLEEFLAFIKSINIPTTDIKKALLVVNTINTNSSNRRILIITRGEDSILVSHGGIVEEFPCEKLDRVVDTNGAGDAFAGGFICAFAQGYDIKECVRCGVWAATEIVQNVGCNFDKTQIYNKK